MRVRQLLLHEPVVRMSRRGAARDDAQRRRRGEGGRQLDGRAPAQLGERTHRVLRRLEPLLESQGHGDGVGEGALVLDRADVRKGRARAPRGAPLGKRAEGRALEFDERLADHRLVLALAPLDGEHGRERHPLCAPLSRRLDEALQARHHPRALLADEGGRGEAEGVAVVRVEGRGQRAAPLVPEIVVLERELARVRTRLGAPRELGLEESAKQPLALDLGDLHVAVGVAVEEQLRTDLVRQQVVHVRRRWRQHLVDRVLGDARVRVG